MVYELNSAYAPELALHYPPQVTPAQSTGERITIFHAHCHTGESQAASAREFDISYQRVHQIVRKMRT